MAAHSFVVVVAAAIFDLAASACTAAGDNCEDTKCCADPTMKCFKKNTYWASCKTSCDPSVVDVKDGKTWSCEVLSAAASSCSAKGQDCTKTTCCAEATQKCFEKDEYYASCSESCTPGDWSCKVRENKCTEAGADCTKTGCCQRGDMKCFKKNEYWASCRKACDPSIPDEDDGSTWNCALVTEPAASPAAPAPTAAPTTTPAPAPTFILDNSGNKRPVLYGP